MFEFMGFKELQVGQRLKVKGNPAADGKFVALEITVKPPSDKTEIEGVIQQVNVPTRTIQMLNREFTLPSDVSIKDLDRNFVSLEVLKPGDIVKLKGNYAPEQGFIPEKVKMKENVGFVVEELQGTIDKIDYANRTLEMAGFTVVVTEKTEIEGF